MFLTATATGIVGVFLNDPRFLIAGAIVTLFALMFVRFKQEPLPPPQPKSPTTPLNVLQMELDNLNNEMNNFSLDEDLDKDGGYYSAYIKLVESRDKISMALIELARNK